MATATTTRQAGPPEPRRADAAGNDGNFAVPSAPAAPSAPTAPSAPAAPAAPAITVTRLSKQFRVADTVVHALDEVHLAVAAGEFVTIVGPSGCGKSTLLCILAGLDEPSDGQLCIGDIGDEPETRPETQPEARRLGACGYMPQRDMLLPWRNVLDNATLPLEYRGMSRAEARREAAALLARFGLADFAHARPATLSGGMRQRVAVARTILTGRRALLLDEPFGALDALTRLEMQQWLLGVWEELRATVILVTHDIEEAVHLSDRVYVMSDRPGRIVAEVPIPLERPRRESIIATPAFATLKGRVLAAVRGGTRHGTRHDTCGSADGVGAEAVV